ncbi:MAG: sugar ABC transporter substrate-binding protein, partial [Dethiobacteria bacterium]|nr:sugar ABC transporter substrate-binding protein [Dethiobacteria bacterium]
MKWDYRFFLIVGLAVILSFGLIMGCGGAEEAVEDEERLTFGMIIKYPGVPFIEAFIYGAQEKADELGIDLIVRDGEGDAMTIMNHMDTFIVEEIDGFIMAGAVDLLAIVPGIERLNEVGIPIIALDTCPEGGKVDYFITADITKQSARAAEALVEGIKERHGGEVPEGVVIEITGDIRDMFTRSASEGFRSILDQYPQLEIASGEGNWNNIGSEERTSDLLTRHGEDVVAIYVQTPDIMGPGAVNAIYAAGLDPKDYGITGIWMAPEGLELLKNGDALAIVAMPAYAPAQMAVQLLYDIIMGVDLPQLGDVIEEEGALWSPAMVVENPFPDEGLMIE